MKKKKINLLPIAIGAASVGIAAALAKGIPLLREKLMSKRSEETENAPKKKTVRRKGIKRKIKKQP